MLTQIPDWMNKTFYLEQNKKEIIEIYQKTHNINNISELCGLSYSILLKFLKSCDIYTSPQKFQHLAPEIIKLYQSGLGSTTIAKRYNTSNGTICDILTKYGIKKRPSQKYTRNSNYFSIINPNNSYWAGLMAADGNINQSRKYFSISLQDKDKYILDAFQSELKYTGKKDLKIATEKRQSQTCLRIYDPKLCQDLINNFNIIPAKSLILQPPSLENIEHILPFIKGYIDGDGTIGYYNLGPGKKQFLVQIIGTKNMLGWMKNKLDELTNDARGNISKKGNVFILRFSGEKGTMIYNLLKSSVKWGLERKWNYENPTKSM